MFWRFDECESSNSLHSSSSRGFVTCEMKKEIEKLSRIIIFKCDYTNFIFLQQHFTPTQTRERDTILRVLVYSLRAAFYLLFFEFDLIRMENGNEDGMWMKLTNCHGNNTARTESRSDENGICMRSTEIFFNILSSSWLCHQNACWIWLYVKLRTLFVRSNLFNTLLYSWEWSRAKAVRENTHKIGSNGSNEI